MTAGPRVRICVITVDVSCPLVVNHAYGQGARPPGVSWSLRILGRVGWEWGGRALGGRDRGGGGGREVVSCTRSMTSKGVLSAAVSVLGNVLLGTGWGRWRGLEGVRWWWSCRGGERRGRGEARGGGGGRGGERVMDKGDIQRGGQKQRQRALRRSGDAHHT